MNRTLPLLIPELAYRLEASSICFSLEKQKALASLSGNPYGVRTRILVLNNMRQEATSNGANDD